MPHPTAHTTSPPPLFALTLASVLLLCLSVGGWFASQQVAMAPSALPANLAVQDTEHAAPLTRDTHARLRLSAAGPNWRDISDAQRQVLFPLRDRWDSMGALAKRRWLVLADRYPRMDAAERRRLDSRMATWASLSAQQRNQARLNFESIKSLSAQELQAKWDAYQALTEAEKKRLAEQRKAKTAKKAKRRLAQPAPTTPPRPQPSSQPQVLAQPPVQAAPVFTPQAAPAAHIAPVNNASSTAEAQAPSPLAPLTAWEEPSVSSQAISVPQATPTLQLPPLPHHPDLPAAAHPTPTGVTPSSPSNLDVHQAPQLMAPPSAPNTTAQ